MNVSVASIVLLICLLQIKHLFADFFLQTRRMLTRRADYLHLGRVEHVTIHAVGTVVALAAMGAAPGLIMALAMAEWVVHYHIDWAKARYVQHLRLTPENARYWYATGTDQALHQLTYLGIAWVWAVQAG